LDSDEQTILVNFYDSLISNGTLDWNIENDLCDQTGVSCDSSDPQKVIKLYVFFLKFLFCKLVISISFKLITFSILEILILAQFLGQFQQNLGI